MTNPVSEFPFPGARWWKFDLHTHTPASTDYGKGPDQPALRSVTPREWLLGYMRAGLDCVVVTDHNSGEWIDPLKEALATLERQGDVDFRPLTLFPGVEITANGGTHVLAVLDLGCDSSDVAELIGAVGYHGRRGASDVAANASPIQVVESICKAGGVPILAHVDGPSGAWELSGNSLAPLLEADGLFAVEVINPLRQKPTLYRERKLDWAAVVGSDSHHPTSEDGTQGPGSRFTWIKMAEPSLEGLRLALLDGGDFSLRRSDSDGHFDPFGTPKHLIESIEVEEARYMGRGSVATVAFTPWLNALVGGRGTGKSTILHALRLAARRQHELADLEEYSAPNITFREFDRLPKDRQDRGGLTPTTAVRCLIRRDDVSHRVHWRQDANGVVVEDRDKDGWKESPSQSVTSQWFPLRLFSQGQIAELAGRNQALLRVVDDAALVVEQRRQLDDARAAFESSRARIREIEQRLRRRDALLVDMQDVERKLARFEATGHHALLTDYRRRERQRHLAAHQLRSARVAADRVDAAADDLDLDELPDGAFGTSSEDRQVASVLLQLDSAVAATVSHLREEAARLRHAAAEQQTQLNGSAWQAAVEKTNSDYQTLVQDLRAEGVADPSEYDKLIQDRALLEDERNQLDSLLEEHDRLTRESAAQRDRVLDARRAISSVRERFLSAALTDNRFVRIAVRRYGFDPKVVERSLRQQLGIADDRFSEDILYQDDQTDAQTASTERGVVYELLVDLPEEPTPRSKELERRVERLKQRIQRACAGRGDFRGHFNNYFKREFNKQPELLDKMLTWFPEDDLIVEHSPGGDGTGFRPIGQASAGERSAAMLAFLLAHGDEPLVLDQPEDDLDNHLIYDLVVRQIRENKLRRQIIVVTHNPNIVVNGDAEMVHVLRFLGGRCVVGQSGSLQDPDIREEVCQIMEGGREAFARRYRRLGRRPSHV